MGLVVSACGDGGGDGGPAAPVTLQVEGIWSETSEVLFDACELADRIGPLTRTVRLSQSGNQLGLFLEGESVGTGSLNPTTGDFVLSGTYTVDGLEISFIQRGRFSSATRYTATSDIIVSAEFVTCEVETTNAGVR
jgi:hypothetical protein